MTPSVFEVISLRSFSSAWYWIMLACLWSAAIHWTMGVPYDLVRRARHGEAEAQRDLERLADVAIRRRLAAAASAGPVGTAVLSALLTALALLGFAYRIELAQALVLLAAPLLAVWLLDQRAARAIAGLQIAGVDLAARLRRLRLRTQGLGLLTIFAAAMWGMWWNLTTSPLAH